MLSILCELIWILLMKVNFAILSISFLVSGFMLQHFATSSYLNDSRDVGVVVLLMGLE